MVKSERRLWNKTTKEVRYYLSSLSSNAEKIALAIRSHLGRQDPLVIVDDRLARYYAKQLNIKFTGILGILLKAKQLGELTIWRVRM